MGGATFLPKFSQGRLLAVNKARPYAVWRGKRTGLKTDHYRNSEKERRLEVVATYGAGKLHALQGNGMEAGGAGGWGGRRRGGAVRLRDVIARVAGEGAGGNSERVGPLRF